jgi:ribosomal protein S18 acetylase RimI-like enzyme
MTGTGFSERSYAIGGGAFALTPLAPGDGHALAAGFADIAPWRTLGFTADRLQGFIARDVAHQARYAIQRGTETAGFVCIDRDWLCGPYLHFLGVLSAHQGQGAGSAVLDWFLGEAQRSGARNAWVCVSDFNQEARQLYERHGFSNVAALDDLLVAGYGEILMRKVLFVTGNT